MILQQNPSTRHTVAMYPKLPICQPIAVPRAVNVDVLADPVPVVDPIAVGLVADTRSGGSPVVVSIDSSQSVQVTIDATVQTNDVATALGQGLAAQLVEAGAGAILKD
ncbi:hypothetical protein V502_02160, partial [Pseudogymnoascus sp. VKM F-4520 (FW-2644)]